MKSQPPQTPPPPKPNPTPPPPPGPGRLYSVIELAYLWGCSEQHVYNLIAAGELAVTDISLHKGKGKPKTRIPLAEVEAYIARNLRRAPKGRAA